MLAAFFFLSNIDPLITNTIYFYLNDGLFCYFIAVLLFFYSYNKKPGEPGFKNFT